MIIDIGIWITFLLAAEELTKKGYYVFRMGVVADKLFKSDNPKIIDYAKFKFAQ